MKENKKDVQTTNHNEDFPYDVFPLKLRIFISVVAESLNCNPEFVAASVLMACSIAIGNKAKIQIKKSWREGAVLFVVVIGEPGSKKSPAISKGMEPITLLQIGYSKIILDESGVLKTIVMTDATIEAIAEKLFQNPHGILLLMDEAIGLIKSFGQYKNGGGNDMEKFLSFWSQFMISIVRKKAPTIQINSPFLSFFGGMQPDLLDTLATMKGNGFVDRLLFVYPKAIPTKHSDIEISDEQMEDYVRTIHNVFNTKVEGDQLVILFSEDAEVLWKEWHTEYCESMNDSSIPYYLKGSLSKLEAYTARFALILEFLKCAENNVPVKSVSLESVQGAIKLTSYFKSQAIKVFSSFTDTAEDKRIERAVAWFIKQPHGKATMRKIYTYKVGSTKNFNEAYDMCMEMKSRGLGVLQDTSEGTRQMYTFHLNPTLIKKSDGSN